MKTIETGVLDVLRFDELPRMGQNSNSFSIYRGVMIVWDEDEDTRIIEWVNSLDDIDREWLLVAHEHEGNIQTIWSQRPYPHHFEGNSYEVACDVWTVDSCVWAGSDKERVPDAFAPGDKT